MSLWETLFGKPPRKSIEARLAMIYHAVIAQGDRIMSEQSVLAERLNAIEQRVTEIQTGVDKVQADVVSLIERLGQGGDITPEIQAQAQRILDSVNSLKADVDSTPTPPPAS